MRSAEADGSGPARKRRRKRSRFTDATENDVSAVDGGQPASKSNKLVQPMMGVTPGKSQPPSAGYGRTTKAGAGCESPDSGEIVGDDAYYRKMTTPTSRFRRVPALHSTSPNDGSTVTPVSTPGKVRGIAAGEVTNDSGNLSDAGEIVTPRRSSNAPRGEVTHSGGAALMKNTHTMTSNPYAVTGTLDSYAEAYGTIERPKGRADDLLGNGGVQRPPPMVEGHKAPQYSTIGRPRYLGDVPSSRKRPWNAEGRKLKRYEEQGPASTFDTIFLYALPKALCRTDALRAALEGGGVVASPSEVKVLNKGGKRLGWAQYACTTHAQDALQHARSSGLRAQPHAAVDVLEKRSATVRAGGGLGNTVLLRGAPVQLGEAELVTHLTRAYPYSPLRVRTALVGKPAQRSFWAVYSSSSHASAALRALTNDRNGGGWVLRCGLRYAVRAALHDDTGDAETKKRRKRQLALGGQQSRGGAGCGLPSRPRQHALRRHLLHVATKPVIFFRRRRCTQMTTEEEGG